MAKAHNRELIRCVRLALSEETEAHWVLFAGGTVVKVYPQGEGEDVWGKAIDLLRGHQLSFFDDFAVQKLPGVEGWWVEIKEQSFFVYIHPSEIDTENNQGLELGLMGKEKFIQDAKTAQPIYVHLRVLLEQDDTPVSSMEE